MNRLHANVLWWSEKSKEYPFHLSTRHGALPKPHHVSMDKYGSFIAVPIQRLGEQPVVMWGFSTAAARDAFAEEYPGVQIE